MRKCLEKGIGCKRGVDMDADDRMKKKRVWKEKRVQG